MGERRGIEREQRIGVRFQPREQLRVADERVLDHLGEARAQFARRQRPERRGVRDHRLRLVEGTDEVLAARMVHAGLAADRRVDLREQRGRHLHEADAALVAGGGEARHVADHPAAQGDDEIVAREAVGDQRVDDARDGVERLVALAVGQHDLEERRGIRTARGRPSRLQARRMERSHDVVGDHRDLAGTARTAEQRTEQRGVAQQAVADEDRVGAVAESDRERGRRGVHGGSIRSADAGTGWPQARSPATMRRTTSLTWLPSVWTVTAATSA